MSAEAPDVTFLIAAFNAERSLKTAIASALAQTGVSVEVVVVDDRSSDGTFALAQGFAGQGVRAIRLPENRGPGGARNAGLAVARGEWIAILDSDDIVAPDRAARLIARAKAADCEVVVDNIVTESEDGVRSDPMFRFEDLFALPRIDLPTFIRSNRLFVSTFNFGYMKPIFKRDFAVEQGLRYNESLRIGEDYLFLASMLASGADCAVEPEAGYIYRVREGSISRVLERQHVAAMRNADQTFERTYPLDGPAREALKARDRSLREAECFLALVEHLKNRHVVAAIGSALREPMALRHLHMPIAKRLQRVRAGRRSLSAPGDGSRSIPTKTSEKEASQ